MNSSTEPCWTKGHSCLVIERVKTVDG